MTAKIVMHQDVLEVGGIYFCLYTFYFMTSPKSGRQKGKWKESRCVEKK